MRTLRLILLTGTVLPGLVLSVPAMAREDGASGTILLAQGGPEERGPRGGGGREGPPGGREGPPGGPPPGRERPEPRQELRQEPRQERPAPQERPQPRPERAPPPERAAPQERAAPPAPRERPEPREERAPARPQERPQPAERAAPPAARERPEPREDRAPAARPQERPQPTERPAERPAPPPAARERAPERAAPPPPPPARRDAPDTVTRPPAAEAPADRTPPARPGAEPGRPTPPPAAPARPEAVERPAPNAAPGVPGRPVQPPGVRPSDGAPPDRATPPGTPPAQPGAVPPNARPGVPGRPVEPPAGAGRPGNVPGGPGNADTIDPQGRPGGPGTAPNAAPGVPGRPFQPPGAAGQPDSGPRNPGQRNPGQPDQGQPGFGRPGPGGPGVGGPGGPGAGGPGVGGPGLGVPGVQPGQPGYDPRGVPTGRVDDRGGFNRPGRPGYVPGGFNADNEDVRDYDSVRRDRREFNEDGRTYIREPGRIIVRDRDTYFIRHDENERFRDLGRDGYRSERRGPDTYTYLDRPGGEQIVTVVDDDGRMLRRYRRFRDGREVMLIDNGYAGPQRPVYEDVIDLPPPDIRIPRERYVVDYGAADERAVYEALSAPPVVAIDRRYTLDQVRYSPQLRARMRSVDIDTINFDTASFTVTADQAARLSTIAAAINQAIRANPQEVFLIEGYTDAVGSDVDNLSLSDRRAQSVATVLTQNFQVPPENLTTQGYGEQYLKVKTQNASRENRRVTVRRITPLLQQGGAAPAAPPR